MATPQALSEEQVSQPVDDRGIPEQTDDLSGAYQAHREQFASATAVDAMEELARSRRQGPAPDAAPVAAAAAPGAAATVGAVVSDIGTSFIDLPFRTAVGGARDAVQNTIDITAELGGWLNENVTDLGRIGGDQDPTLPEVPQPRSVTGKIGRAIATFLTGFVGAGKLTPLKLWRPVTARGRVGKAAAQGAVADFSVFEANEDRLSNLIQEVPALANPISEYLAADPDDNAAEGRFKNAVEGLGLGVAVDGLALGLRALRESRKARAALEQEARPEIKESAFDALGGADEPLVSVRVMPKGQKARRAVSETAGATPDDVKPVMKLEEGQGEVFINFRRIESSEDIQDIMQQLADESKAGIDQARRGKQTFAQIELNAEQVNAWDTLLARRRGEPLNAEQSVAARRLWVASTEKLTEVAEMAANNPSEANLFAFRKMMATHHTIQEEVIAARTETARALASWRIPVSGGDMERYAAIRNLLDQNGGDEVSRELARRVAVLAKQPQMVTELSEMVGKSVYATTRDAVIEAWIMSLLSGPKTHLVNMMSNTSVIFQQMQERAVAAQISRALGADGGVELGEATAQWFGMIDGFKDGLRYAGKSLKTGETGYGLGKIELPREGAISAEAFGMSNAGFLGRAVDGIGQLVRVPGRLLSAEDEFFKTIGYRMELNALSLRQATQEVQAGKIKPEQLKERIAELRANPPEQMRLDAIDQATYQTFTSTPNRFARGLQMQTAQYPWAKILLPFVRTPANIFNYTLERSPLAPLMASYRADIRAGGARRDIALARMSSGTMLMLATVDMAMSGQVSGAGPIDPREREALLRTGWQPYSVKVGDRWFAYNRMDPIGGTLGLAAGFAEVAINADWEAVEPADFDEAFVGAIAAIAGNLMSKTYLTGISDFFEAMADPRRYGEGYAKKLAGSLVPAGVAEAARQADPHLRDANTMLDAIKRRTPGLSQDLPLARDVFGRPISFQSGLGQIYDIFSPIYSRRENPEPIDREVIDQGFGISKPGKAQIFQGVDLGRYPHAYSRFLELSGNELKDPAWGLGAKDLLNQIVAGKHVLSRVYEIRSDGPGGGKEIYIQRIMSRYRNLAKRQLLEEFPEVRREVEAAEENRRQLRMPVMR